MLITIALYHYLKKIPLTLFFVYILVLPFAKGKGIDILLLDKKFVLKNAIFNIDYLFPIYFSSIYLGLFYFYQIRQRLFFEKTPISLTKDTIISIFSFLMLILVGAIGATSAYFYWPVFLSAIQLLLLLLVFLMPFFGFFKKNDFKQFNQIIMSSVLFQCFWLILQTLNKGLLGKDIEVFLPGFEFGVHSTENFDLMRLPGTFFESSILGTFLITNLAVILYSLAKTKNSNHRESKLMIFTVLIGYLSLLLTGSRAIYLVSVLLLLFFAKLKGWLTKNGINSFLSALKSNLYFAPLLIIGVILISPYLINRLGSSNKLFTKEGSATYRLQLNNFAFRLAEKSPFIGVGLNLSPYYFATSFPQEDYFVDPAHPHNILIQLLAETGVFGLASFVLFLYFIFRPTLQKTKIFNQFHLAALFFFLCAQIYPIFINHMEIISYLFVYLGLAAWSNSKHYV